MPILKPMAHQLETLKFLKKERRVFDTSDPGTGKTYSQIVDFAGRRRKKGKCLLVLAPKSLLESAWANDFQKFAPDMRVSVAYAENREKSFAIPADAYITNIDAANWLVKQPKSFFAKFDTLVIDESTAYKHGTSGRSKNVAKIVKYFDYRRCMSGTPNSNGITDLWHQVYLLDDGALLGTSFYGFRNAACIPTQVGPSRSMVNWTDRPGIEAVVANMLKSIVIRHKFEDCVDIPENYRYAVPFKLSDKHMKQYRQMMISNVLPLKKQRVSAINAAVVRGKLLQIASGAVYDEEGNYAPVDSARYELTLDLVEQRVHSIVFFLWQHQRDALIKEATARKLTFAVYDGGTTNIARAQIVKDFQAGKYQVLFAHPQSAGHGLTLVKGTATIWSSPTDNLEFFLQGLKRVHRIGQTEKTETIVIVAEGTIDEHVWARLQVKDGKMLDLFAEMET